MSELLDGKLFLKEDYIRTIHQIRFQSTQPFQIKRSVSNCGQMMDVQTQGGEIAHLTL